MFTIRMFGLTPKTDLTDPKSVLSFLREQKGMHLSVLRKQTNDLSRVFYLSVDNAGIVRESYGEQKVVDEHYLTC